jgi:hypothetical protein
MIEPLRQSTGTRAARGYEGTMAGFWSGLSGTLRALEAIAADGNRLAEDALGPLRTLQYRLHWSGELLDSVRPPAGSREVHDELRDALADARDATAEMVEAIEIGGQDAAAALLFEWRGALFRVRLARMRLGVQPEPDPSAGPPPYRAAAATGLAVLGAAAFLAGAIAIVWPLWAAGIALVAGALLVQRG